MRSPRGPLRRGFAIVAMDLFLIGLVSAVP